MRSSGDKALKLNPELVVRCFEECCLLSGYNEVIRHFPPSKFNCGAALRDVSLPQVNFEYVRAVLCFLNLSEMRGAPVTIPESVMSKQQRTIKNYSQTNSGFRQFYFSTDKQQKSMVIEMVKKIVRRDLTITERT